MANNLRSGAPLSYNDYIATVNRPYLPFLASILLSGISNYRYYRNVISRSFAIRGMVFLDAIWYYRKREIERAGKIALDEWKNRRGLLRARRYFARCEQKIDEAAMLGDARKYITALEAYMPALILVWTCGDFVEAAIRERLQKKISADAVRQLMDKLNIPFQDNFYKQEEYELVTSKDIKLHAQKYRWLKSRYGSLTPYTIKEAKSRLRHINRSEFLRKRKQGKEVVRRAIR